MRPGDEQKCPCPAAEEEGLEAAPGLPGFPGLDDGFPIAVTGVQEALGVIDRVGRVDHQRLLLSLLLLPTGLAHAHLHCVRQTPYIIKTQKNQDPSVSPACRQAGQYKSVKSVILVSNNHGSSHIYPIIDPGRIRVLNIYTTMAHRMAKVVVPIRSM